MCSCPFHLLMSCIKRRASFFPFSAAFDMSASARSGLYSIPHANAQHLARITMDSASPRATQSSISDTTFASSFSTPQSPQNSCFAILFFALTPPCDDDSSNVAVSSVLDLFFGGIACVFGVCVYEKKGEKQFNQPMCEFFGNGFVFLLFPPLFLAPPFFFFALPILFAFSTFPPNHLPSLPQSTHWT